jgi:hypothetical protein
MVEDPAVLNHCTGQAWVEMGTRDNDVCKTYGQIAGGICPGWSANPGTNDFAANTICCGCEQTKMNQAIHKYNICRSRRF